MGLGFLFDIGTYVMSQRLPWRWAWKPWRCRGQCGRWRSGAGRRGDNRTTATRPQGPCLQNCSWRVRNSPEASWMPSGASLGHKPHCWHWETSSTFLKHALGPWLSATWLHEEDSVVQDQSVKKAAGRRQSSEEVGGEWGDLRAQGWQGDGLCVCWDGRCGVPCGRWAGRLGLERERGVCSSVARAGKELTTMHRESRDIRKMEPDLSVRA